MPVINTYVDNPEFEVKVAATECNAAYTLLVFLSRNLIIQVVEEENEYGDINEEQYTYAMIVDPNRGILYWNDDDEVWVPDEEACQKGYSDYVAEQELLKNPQVKKGKK